MVYRGMIKLSFYETKRRDGGVQLEISVLKPNWFLHDYTTVPVTILDDNYGCKHGRPLVLGVRYKVVEVFKFVLFPACLRFENELKHYNTT